MRCLGPGPLRVFDHLQPELRLSQGATANEHRDAWGVRDRAALQRCAMRKAGLLSEPDLEPSTLRLAAFSSYLRRWCDLSIPRSSRLSRRGKSRHAESRGEMLQRYGE